MKRISIAMVALLVAGGFVFAGGSAEKSASSGAAVNIVSMVDESAQTPIADLESSLGTPTVPNGAKFAYVTRTLSNEFWRYESDGFTSEAKKLGVTAQVYAVTNEASITEQLDKAQSAAEQGFTALMASPISATALDSVFKAELAKGVPCIILNDARGTLPGVVYIGPDALKIGATAAAYIAKLLPNGGNVAMIEGDPGSSNARNRGIGFKQELAKHPNLTLVGSQTAMWDENQAKTIATAMLTAHPDIKAFYAQNDVMGLGVEAAIAEKGLTGKVLLVGTDGIPQAKKEIAAGRYTATVSERPTTEGETGVEAALWLLEGKKLPGWIEVPAILIDKSNVSEYMNGMP